MSSAGHSYDGCLSSPGTVNQHIILRFSRSTLNEDVSTEVLSIGRQRNDLHRVVDRAEDEVDRKPRAYVR